MDFNQTINADGVRWGTAALDAGAERRRAHLKQSAKGQSAEQMPWTDPFWLPVLVEEVGEVARAMCDRESAERVREELIQVAAMALAWADAIGHTLANEPAAEGDGRG
jgi:NTP pyrophosphatase (non-canonical NTP hydrolase)